MGGCSCHCQCQCNENDDRLEKSKKVITKYKEQKGALIPIMHEIQGMYGYLPEACLQLIAKELQIPMAEIYGVATFYSQFSLEPKGEHIIRVCMGTACYVKGAQGILDKLCAVLDVEVDKTTKDGKFTVEGARCLGSCGLAPVMTIGDRVYGRVSPNDIDDILEEYK